MAVPSGNPNNNNIANHALQGLPNPPRAPNPNNGIMAAPGGYPRVFGGGAFARNLGIGPRQMIIPQPQHQHVAQADDDDDDDEPLSPLTITINNPLYIKGDSNVVSVDPSDLSQRIALAIATSLTRMGGMIPMVDENGTPRGININVNAETRIEGSKNLVGEKFDGPIKAEKEDEEEVAALAVVTNGAAANGASGKVKRKAANLERDEEDVAAGGLRIKLEPDDGDARDHSVKRTRRG